MIRSAFMAGVALIISISPLTIYASAEEEELFQDYMADARNGDSTAQFVVARRLEKGIGTKKDSEQSLYWYKQAADNGHALAKLFVERKLEAAKAKAKPAPVKAKPKPKPAPVKTVKVKAKAKAKPAPKKAAKQTFNTEQIISSGNWRSGKQAIGFLPSIRTSCLPSSGELICFSEKFKQTIGGKDVTYTVKSNVSNFDSNGSFKVKYKYNVLDISTSKKKSKSFSPGIKAKTGWQEPGVNLNCRLNNSKSTTCKGPSGAITLKQ
ncbi:MAG: sel1 repeat family protein [Proteobacteria bacterium]|nr:sel1 repeat family protein [Pseudomonadota bacterium]